MKSLNAWGRDAGRWGVLVHGGAGDVDPTRLALHVEGCLRAAMAAARRLEGDGSALDAAQIAVEILEDDPCFNAATGACLTRDGHIELDASIMDGHTLRTGGVCAIPPFRHPVAIARAVMEKSPHVLLAGEGARAFAECVGFTRADESAMITDHARNKLAEVRRANTMGTSGGTVGAVVLDARGNVVAATSTGGRVAKWAGRIGDSPIPGAGNYADNETGACSTTGDGEAFLRLCTAKSACDRLRDGTDPRIAAEEAIATLAARVGGKGGLILVDRHGRIGLARNTRTMTWAAVGETFRRGEKGA